MKKIEMQIYEDTNREGVTWVAFTDIAFDAFKHWISSVALSSKAKIVYKKNRRAVLLGKPNKKL